MHPDHRGLAFLLSLGALACNGGETGEGSGATTSTTPATTPEMTSFPGKLDGFD